MKKALRFIALVGVIGVSSWLSSPQAQAASNCGFLANRTCQTVGSRVSCCYDGECGGYCTCGLDHRWKCVF